MKKVLSIILTAAILLTTACSDNNVVRYDDTLPQCEPANISHSQMLNMEYATMKGTDGYYYCGNSSVVQGDYTVYYYDKESKTTIPLCAKPQCAHDGNDFCVATGGKQVMYTLFYNNCIYKLCRENTEEQMYEYKLLKGDKQGNELSVVTEFLTAPNVQQIHISNVLCHYGVMFFVMRKYNDDNYTNHIYAIDLVSGAVKEIEVSDAARYEQYPFMTADGDYLYFAAEDVTMDKNQTWVRVDADTVMHRYNLKTGETEIISDMPKIYSSFTVNDGVIYYTTVDRGENTFSLVSFDTEKKETKTLVENRQMVYLDGKYLSENGMKVSTDRKYLYIRMTCGSGFAEAKDKRGMEIYIYDMNGKPLYEGLLIAENPRESEEYRFSAIDGEMYLLCKFWEYDENSQVKIDEASGLYTIRTDELVKGSKNWQKLYQVTSYV